MHQIVPRRAVIAVALGASCAAASAALPPFTLNPAAAGLAGGGTINADNILISDYTAVTESGTSFSETGLLSVSAFQLGGVTSTPAGLNSTYGLFIAFTGVGTTSAGDPAVVPTFGSFSSLTYTLYGYNGTATFGFSGNTPTETAASPIALASGSLINGTVITAPAGNGTFTPSANASLTLGVSPGEAGFFQFPVPFYNMAMSAFTNTTSEVEPFSGGFRVRQGGGSINFASSVPEPGIYALMFAGLSVMGFIARTRKRT